MTDCQENFESQPCRLNSEFPHIRASPYGKVSCDCCGVGFVEIYPYCTKDLSISDAVNNRWKYCCLPPVSISAPITNPGYCYCGPPREVDDMIVCDNQQCCIVANHLKYFCIARFLHIVTIWDPH